MSQDQPPPSKTADLPALPLRDVVVFPHMVIPLFVGRPKSIEALQRANQGDKQILLIAQKDPGLDQPDESDLYQIGTLANILQLLKLPDGTVKVLVEGITRVSMVEFSETDECLVATVETCDEQPPAQSDQEPLMRSLINQFERYVRNSEKVPPEIVSALNTIDAPGRLADTIASHLSLRLQQKQELLETLDIGVRLQALMREMEAEIDLIKVEKRMRSQVKKQMEKGQREYYLNEQMKAIQKELGDLDEGGNELDELADKIEKAGMPKEALQKTRSEFNKLKMMAPMAAEATVVRNYVDWMVSLPWKKQSRVRSDLAEARAILDADHFGLEKVKERILEYLAVQQRVKKLKGPILCLVGPPGVGKTSLGQSIAKATRRKFSRMSLGGVRDEAEIRGHRRTYIGSMPGKIVQNLAKVGTRNPLFMLDEIDKMAMDFRGDPASALLEVLDPQQNHTFNDHYLEVDYDLSHVMFIATSNTLNIPPALLDRMEVIHLSGYTEDEKMGIAKEHLLGKVIKDHGLKTSEIQIADTAVLEIIRCYTREAGVRNLEREINKICRKVVKELTVNPEKKKVSVSGRNLEKFLGVPRFRFGRADEQDRVGNVTGLAWTEVGGELLSIEAAVLPGKGNLVLTGKLGDVMQESIKAALTVVRSRAASLGISADFYQNHDFHVHVPEGAIPKDGPSAGVGMCTALVSALTKIEVSATVAMTGEITLRGEVLPIGGLKEKLLAALRGGIKTVIIPEENRKDLSEIPDNVKKKLKIVPVRWVEEAIELALTRSPEPIEPEKKLSEKAQQKENSLRAH
ncbi:MAG: endopeptidase La [Gammaproteobacteria bacterium]|nr:MAG: endopeptidase La [Gammaproteobacteria bacterium]RLA15200.1 MAG: endopeptidase La [Gammaproteobacteria bacterium]